MTDLLQQSDVREATERAARIRLGITTYLATLADIRSAWDRRDWQTLGYADWDAYLDGEFSETRLRVPAEHRTKAITELRMAGMSTRAIASAVNLSQSTVAKDVRDLSEKTQVPLPGRIKTLDGKERPATQPKPAQSVPAESAKPTASPQTQSLPVEPQLAETIAEPKGEVRPQAPTPEDNAAPEPAEPAVDARPASEEDALRRSRMFIENLGGLFLALNPSPVGWLQRNWRPVRFSSRELPLVRDAFTSSGLRTLAGHLHALADHLDKNGESL